LVYFSSSTTTAFFVSPLLRNYVRPEEVRIVRRDPICGTKVVPMTDVPNLHELLHEFGVGERG
jgi:hypothetical protein